MSDERGTRHRSRQLDAGVLAIAIGLFALAVLVSFDASRIDFTHAYATIGPKAMPYAVASGLVLFAVLTLVAALRGRFPEREPEHWEPIAWIVGGLVFQICAVAFGFGFIAGTAVLFATTSRAFGRKAIATDLGIGLMLGIAVYLMFTKVLTLSLPQGPLERLL